MQISDIMLLRLYEEHNSVIRKNMEELIFMPVGSQHYTLSLRFFVVMHVKVLFCNSSS
jgi:hypothetical protein